MRQGRARAGTAPPPAAGRPAVNIPRYVSAVVTAGRLEVQMRAVTVRTMTGYQVEIRTGPHSLISDEGPGTGDDAGPSPHELLLGSLGSCIAITLEMYARRKEWPLEGVTVDLTHDKVPASGEGSGRPADRFTIGIRLRGELDEEQCERLAYIAGRCPVRRTLEGTPVFEETVTLDRASA